MLSKNFKVMVDTTRCHVFITCSLEEQDRPMHAAAKVRFEYYLICIAGLNCARYLSGSKAMVQTVVAKTPRCTAKVSFKGL